MVGWGKRNASIQVKRDFDGRGGTAWGDVEYLRRVYVSTREWYVAVEKKAQLLLTANGAFVTIVLGTLLGRAGTADADVRIGPAGVILFSVSGSSVVAAITCATLSLWSLHGNSRADLEQLKVRPDEPASYRPEALWYFGHLALLQREAAVDTLLRGDRIDEAKALSYNLVDLARKVMRKHQWVNAGWALTAVALITLAGATASVLSHA